MAGQVQVEERVLVRELGAGGVEMVEAVVVEPGIRREAGLVFPVLVEAGTWADVVAWGPEQDLVNPHTCQMESGRLWDVVWMLRCALLAQRARDAREGSAVRFLLYRVPADRPEPHAELVHLQATVRLDPQGDPYLLVTRTPAS